MVSYAAFIDYILGLLGLAFFTKLENNATALTTVLERTSDFGWKKSAEQLLQQMRKCANEQKDKGWHPKVLLRVWKCTSVWWNCWRVQC